MKNEDNDPDLTVINYHTVKPDPNYRHDCMARRFRNLAPKRTALDRYVEFGTIWQSDEEEPCRLIEEAQTVCFWILPAQFQQFSSETQN
jgi:hypothetical protein